MKLLVLFALLPVVSGLMLAQSKPQIQRINPPALSAPTGYTHVVQVNGGRTIYIAGQVSLDKAGNVVGAGDFKAQTRQVFDNLKAALAAVGATFDNVVKTNMYVTDLSEVQALRDIRKGYYGGDSPASTLVQVVRLARPEFMIEVEAIAVIP
jgi:reactive intermediate/imine deaminase